MALIIVELFFELANFEPLVFMYVYIYIYICIIYMVYDIYIYICMYIYKLLYIYVYIYIWYSQVFEVANIESWPEWDFNQQPLNSFQTF